MPRRELAIGGALLAVYTIWGTTFLAIALALRGFPPFFLGGVRYLAAAAIMATIALALRQARPTAREAGAAMGLGLIFVAVGNGVLTWAEQWVETGTAALLGAIGPLFVLAFEALLPGGDRPTVRGAAGVALGFLGVALLMGPTLGQGKPGTLAGEVALLVSTALGSAGLILAKRLPMPASWLWSSTLNMVAGGAAMFVLALALGEPSRLAGRTIPPEAWGGLVYLTVFGSCVGYSAFAYLTHEARPALVSTISYVIPVLATALGAWVLAEPITGVTLAAVALIVGSVALVATGGRRPAVSAGNVRE